MDSLNIFPAFAFILSILHFLLQSRRRSDAHLPPGPPRRLITGNISQIRGGKPYKLMADLARTYGPVMSLRLGTVTTVVVSGAEAAREVLIKHDAVLSNRNVRHVAKALHHHKSSLIWSDNTEHWRNLRKICSMHMFSSRQLDATEELRRRKLTQLRGYFLQSSQRGETVDVGGAIFTTILNMISNTLFSVDLASYGSEQSHEFEEIIFGTMEISANPNVADFFPALQWVDPRGARRQAEIYSKKMLAVFDEIIDERLKEREGRASVKNGDRDVLEALLDLKLEEHGLTLNDVKHLFLDLFLAGIDTTSSVLEWAAAELLHHPDKMAKAQAELRGVVGGIRESHVQELPYLQAVLKEALRLHPPAPLLLPHRPRTAVGIGGFTVPEGGQVLVNVWAIGRDPEVWEDAEVFMPERFVGSRIDVKGQDFELVPFSAGRRICPGMSLAGRMMAMILGTIVGFGWRVAGEMDMSDKMGITLVKKAHPIRAIPVFQPKD